MDEQQNQNTQNSPKNMNTFQTINTMYRTNTDELNHDSKLALQLPPADGGMHPPSNFGFSSLGTIMTSIGDISFASIGDLNMEDSTEGIEKMASCCNDDDGDSKQNANPKCKRTNWYHMFKNELTQPRSGASLPPPDETPILKAAPELSSSKIKKSLPSSFYTTRSDSMEPLNPESLGLLSLSDPEWLVRDATTTGVALNTNTASLQHLLQVEPSKTNATSPSNDQELQDTSSTNFWDFYANQLAGTDTKTPPPPATAAATTKTETKSRRRAAEPESKQYVDEDEVSDRDVLCGRGGRSNHFPGNKYYLKKIAETKPTYHQCQLKSEKTRVAQSVVDYINHERKGRFLELDKGTGLWFIVSNRTARTKAGQALRDNNTPEARAKKREKYGR